MALVSLRVFFIILSTFIYCCWGNGFAKAASSESLSDGQSLLRAMAAWQSNFTTWVGNDPCQQWDGVLCNNDHRVVFLNLSHKGVRGPIPQEIGNLIYLETLDLNNPRNAKPPLNQVTGDLSALQSLTNLQSLSLYRNGLTGPIPKSWRNLKHIYNLWLHDNYLTKSFPTWINEIPTLTNLSLDWNYLYGSLPNFEGFKVQIVTITCNFFSGTLPSTQPPHDSKIKCRQSAYFDCNAFQQVANGQCPACPLGQFLEDPETCVCSLDKGGGSKIKVTVGSIVGVGSFLLILAFAWWTWATYHRRPIRPPSRYPARYFETQGAASEFWEGPEGVVRFDLEDLARATDNFNSQHEIGTGGFGKVFYAVLDGRNVAIKRAHLSSIQSSSGFRNEVLLLSRLHHKNLVHLLGFCEDEGIQILVYEYMPNGNLHTLLFKNHVALDWLKRLDIAIGIAQGLEYLHSFADPPVIHRDVKPSNILLDDNLVAKLADFGISKVAKESETHFATRPAGTVGYIDPQYILREELTTASDVYSFGMVLLELISGQKAIDTTRMDERNLVEWVKLKLDSDGLAHVVDPRLGDRFPSHIYQDIVRVAIDCASFKSEDRPSMKAVVTILDACRWSVSPYELPNEDLYTTQSSNQQGPAGNTDSSITVESTDTFTTSFLLPR